MFHIAYVLRSKGRDRRHAGYTAQWTQRLDQALLNGITPRHQDLLMRKLTRIRQLMSFHDALAAHPDRSAVQAYLEANHNVFQNLAISYRSRPAPERAFFAHLMAQYHPGRGREHDQLAEILLDFLDDSTVYCRHNVLLALCSMGNAGAVEKLLRRFQQEGWYHNPRLLSDGLMTFFGSREALARRLWAQCRSWEELSQVAVVQFAAQLSDEFAPAFLSALTDPDTLLETRFALIRYFQRHPVPEAKPALLKLALDQDTNGPAIAACAALARYPGQDTVCVLEEALHSRSWNIRRNAAASLAALGVTPEQLPRLAESQDRYAMEILQYMSRNRKAVGA